MGRKIFVAVHGIGDQPEFEPAQAVARRAVSFFRGEGAARSYSFGDFSSCGTRLPDGSPEKTAVLPITFQKSGTCGSSWIITGADEVLAGHAQVRMGFTEVHWANICRKDSKAGYRLQDTVPWAQSVVDRIQSLYEQAVAKRKAAATTPQPTTPVTLSKKTKAALQTESEVFSTPPDYQLIKSVFSELGYGIEILGRFMSFAPKLGLPSMKIDTLLTEVLGDVQFVAEFKDIREKIIDRFVQTMNGLGPLNEDDEIYFISHSEGTVVTFLSLLTVMSQVPTANDAVQQAAAAVGQAQTIGETAAAKLKIAELQLVTAEAAAMKTGKWLKHVRGWVTLGSPIDKHLVLWPELWEPFESALVDESKPKILWRNYYDEGDPVGFDLDTAKKWVASTEWQKVFDCGKPGADGENCKSFDTSFTRYALPGKAHVDYWDDPGLFANIFQTVAGCKPVDLSLSDVKTKRFEKWSSYVVPYLLAFAVLLLGTYFFVSGSHLARGVSFPIDIVFWESVSIASLLAGTTALARIPRLARGGRRFWVLISVAMFAIGAGLFCWGLPPAITTDLGEAWFKDSTSVGSQHIQGLVKGVCIFLGLAVATTAWFRRRHGLKTFVKTGLGVLLGLSTGLSGGLIAFTEDQDHPTTIEAEAAVVKAEPVQGEGTPSPTSVKSTVNQRVPAIKADPKPSLWPFVTGSIALLYLWSLAAIIFDLTYIWHRYIKTSRVDVWLNEIRIRSK